MSMRSAGAIYQSTGTGDIRLSPPVMTDMAPVVGVFRQVSDAHQMFWRIATAPAAVTPRNTVCKRFKNVSGVHAPT